MGWQIEFDDAAKKDLAKIDKSIAKRIIAFLRERVANLDQPRAIGEALTGTRLGEFLKYRVGDYRIISRIEDNVLQILVVRIGHRKEIYKQK